MGRCNIVLECFAQIGTAQIVQSRVVVGTEQGCCRILEIAEDAATKTGDPLTDRPYTKTSIVRPKKAFTRPKRKGLQ